MLREGGRSPAPGIANDALLRRSGQSPNDIGPDASARNDAEPAGDRRLPVRRGPAVGVAAIEPVRAEGADHWRTVTPGRRSDGQIGQAIAGLENSLRVGAFPADAADGQRFP